MKSQSNRKHEEKEKKNQSKKKKEEKEKKNFRLCGSTI